MREVRRRLMGQSPNVAKMVGAGGLSGWPHYFRFDTAWRSWTGFADASSRMFAWKFGGGRVSRSLNFDSESDDKQLLSTALELQNVLLCRARDYVLAREVSRI